MAVTYSLTVGKDEWTPTLRLLKGKGTPQAMRSRMVETGQKIVTLVKVSMSNQVGFADGVPYRRLKIRWRYHGRKELVASKRNLARAARGAVERDVMFSRGGVLKPGRVVSVVDKTPVTASSKALIDLGDLQRSWGMIGVTPHHVDVGNRSSLEKLKAVYNDDRGHWWWGKVSTEKAIRAWLDDFDKGIFR